MALLHGAAGWSAVCDCGISRSYSLFASSFLKKENKKVIKAVYSCSIEIIKGLTDKELR